MEIYKITNILNEKIYVGQSKYKNPNYYGTGTLISKAIQKHGKESFKKEVLETIEDESLLDEREIFWIAFYKERGHKLYNIQPGGRGWSRKVLDEYWENRHKEERDDILTTMAILHLSNFVLLPKKKMKKMKKTKDLLQKVTLVEKTAKGDKKVYQFDKEGNLLMIFENLQHAFDSLPNLRGKGNLCSACNGWRNYCGGYRWSYSEKPNPVSLKKPGRKTGTKDSHKRFSNHKNATTFTILQFNEDDKLLKEWESAKEVSSYLGVSKQCVLRAAKKNSSYKGFIWKQGKKYTKTVTQ